MKIRAIVATGFFNVGDIFEPILGEVFEGHYKIKTRVMVGWFIKGNFEVIPEDFSIGDVVVSKNYATDGQRHEILLVTKHNYFIRYENGHETIWAKGHTNANYKLAPPLPVVMKRYNIVSVKGIIFGSNYASEIALRNTLLFKGHVANGDAGFILEVTSTNTDGVYTYDSRVIPL